MYRIILILIFFLLSQVTILCAGCLKYEIIDHGGSVEAVCIGAPPTDEEIIKKQQEEDIAEYAEKYVNKGRTRQQYEECKALWPEARTADDYLKMTPGQTWAEKKATKAAMTRLEAMGCIPREGSGAKMLDFVSCTTTGGFTNCSDGTSFNRTGNLITSSNGYKCVIVGSTMNCSKR